MSWAIGFDSRHNRDIGYGVPALCDHPECNKHIDRGLTYVCGGLPYGGDSGCGLYFCSEHLVIRFGREAVQMCERCIARRKPFQPKPDVFTWVYHKMTDPSWEEWREEQRKLERLAEAK